MQLVSLTKVTSTSKSITWILRALCHLPLFAATHFWVLSCVWESNPKNSMILPPSASTETINGTIIYKDLNDLMIEDQLYKVKLKISKCSFQHAISIGFVAISDHYMKARTLYLHPLGFNTDGMFLWITGERERGGLTECSSDSGRLLSS